MLKYPVEIITERSPLFREVERASLEELVKKDFQYLRRVEKMFSTQIRIFFGNGSDFTLQEWCPILAKIQEALQMKTALRLSEPTPLLSVLSKQDERVISTLLNPVETIALNCSYESLIGFYQEVEHMARNAFSESKSEFWARVANKLRAVLQFYPTPIWDRRADFFNRKDLVYLLFINPREPELSHFDCGRITNIEEEPLTQLQGSFIVQRLQIEFLSTSYPLTIQSDYPFLIRKSEMKFLQAHPEKLTELLHGCELSLVEIALHALEAHREKKIAK